MTTGNVPPGDFLTLGCPQTRAAATYRLTDWLGPADNTTPAPAATQAPAPEELAARKGATGNS